MTYDAQRIAIQSRFKTEWESVFPAIPIAWQNVAFTPPDDSAYVQIDILNGEAALQGLGNSKLYRYAGVISVDIYLPIQRGIKDADQYSDTIDNIFRGQSFGGILCRAATRNDLGRDENYWRVNVSIPFQRDELFSS